MNISHFFQSIIDVLSLVPYSWRLAFLALLLTLVALLDLRRNRAQARRWRDYLFLTAAGAAGVAFFLAFDAAAALISRDYYSLSKGFEDTEPFYSQLNLLSFKTGLPSGFIVGAIFLLANNPMPDLPPLPLPRLLRFLLYPIACAIIVAPLTAAFFVSADPLGHGAYFTSYLKDHDKIQRLLVAQGVNVGLYIGSGIGVLWAVARIRAARRVMAAASAPPSVPPPAPAAPNPP